MDTRRWPRLFGTLLLVMATVATSAHAQTATDPGVLERDLDDLLAWFEGEFTNWRQVEATGASTDVPPWLEARLAATTIDGLEGRLRSLELASGSSPEMVLQRRVYAFFVDVAADAVVMRTLVPAERASWPPAATDLEPMTGCDLVWRRMGPGFVGTSNPATCRSAAADSGVPVERVMRLVRDRLEIVDRSLTDGESSAEPPLVLHRARRYTGTLTVGDVTRSLELHDEGGRRSVGIGTATWLVSLSPRLADQAPAEIVELRVEREDGGAVRPVASAAAPAGAERFGVVVPGASVELARDPASAGVATLAGWLTGSFSSAAQAATDDEFFDIRLHMEPIWTGREDGPWLYVEQAVADAQDRPYRQRVYRLREVEPGLFESAVFTLPDPEAAIGAWRAPEGLDGVSPADLEPRAGCAILMRRDGAAFVGSTLGTLCPSDLRGARYATSEVRVSADGLVSWDRGFDAAGAQVWGARTGGYVFDRMTDAGADAGSVAAEGPSVGDGTP